MRLATIGLFALGFALGQCPAWATADDLPGFPREDFGKVVLSSRQLAGGGDLEASFGNYNNEPISNYDERSILRRLGRSVGRLDVLTNVRTFPCTAFLISEKHLVTNYHCVPGVIELPEAKQAGVTRIDAVQIVLGYTQEGVAEQAKRYTVSPVPLEASRDLDYAILEVFGEPAATFGTLKVAAVEPLRNSPLLIIGHPLGKAQSVSREQCKTDNPAVSAGRLRHTCDTLPGNSGSPVIDDESRQVIALHHAGSARNTINYAVPMADIVKRSAILASLVAGGERVAAAEVPTRPPTVNRPAETVVAMMQPPPVAVERCPGIRAEIAGKGTICLDPADPAKREFQDCKDGFCGPVMVALPKGSYKRGSPDNERNHEADERPVRDVTIGYHLAAGKYEVMRGEFAAFVEATGHKIEGGCYTWTGSEWNIDSNASWQNPGFDQTDRDPVTCVNWQDARAYVAWMSSITGQDYRLLTEAEWEYGARAGTTTAFHFGAAIGTDQANYDGNSTYGSGKKGVYRQKTVAAGSFKPNTFGLHDMHGNVGEWVEDCYAASYADAPTDGTKAPDTDKCRRVVRGGAFYFSPRNLRSASRPSLEPDIRNYGQGFRVARSVR